MKILIAIILVIIIYFGCANWVVVAAKIRAGENFIMNLLFALLLTVPPLSVICAAYIHRFLN